MITQNYGLVHPSCEVLVNGQKRKLYGKNKNKVYLNNGDEIQLKVYNPLSTRVGFQLKMNGYESDNAILVVNPGQTAVIERFIGTNRKIKFNTYVVDKNNSQTKQAIKENGKLEVYFYTEYINNNWVQPITINPIINPIIQPIINPPIYTPPYNPYPIWYQQPINICGGTTSNGGLYRTTTDTNSTSSGYYNCDFGVSSAGYKASSANAGSASTNFNYDTSNSINLEGEVNVKGNLRVNGKLINSDLHETGRIEKGNKSNQHFSQTQFVCGNIIKTYLFKLLPYSEKKEDKPTQTTSTSNYNPYIVQNTGQVFNNNYVRSEFREYCPNKRCNYRIRKSNWSYCPICGQKID